MRKVVSLVLIIAMLMTLALSGCANNNDNPTSNPTSSDGQTTGSEEEKDTSEQIELKIWFGRENFIPGDAFETFMAENDNVTVKVDVIPLEEAVSEYMKAYAAGNAPDIVQVPADGVPALANQNMLLDMTENIETWKSEYPEGYGKLADLAWEMASWDGVPYGVTLNEGPFWYVYRKDLFDQAGISLPKTWDDVIEAGKKLTTDERIGFSIIGSRAHDPVWFLSLFMSMGGQFENNVPQIDSEAGIYLLEFYQKLMREDIADRETLAWDSGSMRAAFIGGNAAQALIGDNIFPTVQEEMTYGNEWAASAPPVRPGAENEASYMALGWPLLVNASTEHSDEVLKLLEYMSRTEIIKEVAMRYQPTTNIEVLNDEEYVEAKPWAPEFVEPFSKLKPLPAHPKQAEIYQVLLDAMQDSITNYDADASAMAKSYQEDIDAIVG